MKLVEIKFGDVVMCWRRSREEYWTCKVLQIDAARVRPVKLCPYYDGEPWLHQTFRCSPDKISMTQGFEPTLGPVFTNPKSDLPPVQRPAYAQRPRRRSYSEYYCEPPLNGPPEVGKEYVWGRGTKFESVLSVTGFDNRATGERWVRSDDLTGGARIGHPESVFRSNCRPFNRGAS